MHEINRTLATILENQKARADAALEDLPDDLLTASPGGGCKSIAEIGTHLIMLRRFTLGLMESPLAEQVPEWGEIEGVDKLRALLEKSTDLLAEAIAAHDPDDWYAVPQTPREGMWGADPTIVRVSRPFNDYVNHLGSIRAIRRILGTPAERTQ